MSKRIRWSASLAYVVGLITTDGCLSGDGRHIGFTSKDLEQIQNFRNILGLTNKIGLKFSGYSKAKYYRIEFGNVKFYKFLLKIGLTPNKSKTIKDVAIPEKYFRDFLRGLLDGDGYTYSYFDPRWKNSFMFYTSFVSASLMHLVWLSNGIERMYKLRGRIKRVTRAYQLQYAKKASIELLTQIYYKNNLFCLQRKRFKIKQALDIIHKQAEVAKWHTL